MQDHTMSKVSRLLFLVLLCSCGDPSGIGSSFALTGEPVALDGQLLLFSSRARAGILLDAVSERPDARTIRFELPEGALRAERRNGAADEALVICSGRRDSASGEAEPATLAVVDNRGQVRGYALGATPFNTLVQSEDGRYAVLYRSGEQAGRTLQNVNELVVVDLDKDPEDTDAVVSKTPEGLAHAFTSAVISPELPVAGEDRRLLVLLSAAEVTLFDLGHLDRRGTIVELASGSGQMPQPKQVLFGADQPILYVRGEAANDVFVFRLESRDGGIDLNDFRPTVNPLGAGSSPKDIALFGANDAQQLLVVSADSDARVVNPDSGKTQTVSLPWSAEHIRLFEAAAPNDDQPKPRALLYSSKVSAVTFMELEGLDDRPERKLETLALSAPVVSVIALDDPNSLVLTHPQGVTLLDLAQRTVTPIAASGSLDGALFDAQTKRLWVASRGTPWVGTLDLTSGETGEVLLDAGVGRLVPFFAAGRLAIVHESDIGYVTFLDTDSPSRKTAQSVRGFLLADVLDPEDE